MVQFEEEDLFYTDYINTMGNQPDYIAIEDFEILDLREKYHVIFFCDAYLKRQRLDKTIEAFQKAEKIVRHKAATNIPIKELYRYVEQNWTVSELPVVSHF